MKTESIHCRRHRRMRMLDIINNIVTFINAVGIAFLALSLLNVQNQLKTLFGREVDTSTKVSVIEKTLEAREKIYAEHVAWSLKHIKHKPTSTNTVMQVESTGGN